MFCRQNVLFWLVLGAGQAGEQPGREHGDSRAPGITRQMTSPAARVIVDEAGPPCGVAGVAGYLLQPREDARLDPLAAALADGGSAAGAVGDGLVRAAEAEYLDELLEDDAVAGPRPVAAQRVSRVIDGARGQKRGELSRSGSSSHDGMAGTGTPVITKRTELR